MCRCAHKVGHNGETRLFTFLEFLGEEDRLLLFSSAVTSSGYVSVSKCSNIYNFSEEIPSECISDGSVKFV
jgi:hypothetical protein